MKSKMFVTCWRAEGARYAILMSAKMTVSTAVGTSGLEVANDREIRARHRYESVRVVENIERGEPSNTQWPTSGFPLTRCRGVSVRGS